MHRRKTKYEQAHNNSKQRHGLATSECTYLWNHSEIQMDFSWDGVGLVQKYLRKCPGKSTSSCGVAGPCELLKHAQQPLSARSRSRRMATRLSRRRRWAARRRLSEVLPSCLFGDFEAIPARHSVVPHRNRRVQRGMADRGIWRHNYSIALACPTAKTTRIKLTRPSPGAVLAVIKQFDKFRRGDAPGALGHDHCKHAIVRKAAASPRHPSLIEMQGLLRIAGILATQIDR